MAVKRLSAEQPTIGNQVQELRHVMNLSQEKFADVLGMRLPSVNRWEKGRATPSALVLQQIEILLQQLGDRTQYFAED